MNLSAQYVLCSATAQAEAGAHGTPVLQQPAGDDNAKLAAPQPVLEELKNLVPRPSAPSAA